MKLLLIDLIEIICIYIKIYKISSFTNSYLATYIDPTAWKLKKINLIKLEWIFVEKINVSHLLECFMIM